jgi:hypothetical protein
MPADRPRSPRTLLIPDHLWDAFATMASEMGADRDALVSQAMYTLARLNGFLVAPDLRSGFAEQPAADGDLAPRAAAPPRIDGAQSGDADRAAPPLGAATSMELPNLAQYGVVRVGSAPGATSLGGRVLVLYSDGRELDRVTKDRFLIGRGKHCDLVINSGKVSREHAAIVRNGTEYFIEDLGSSNGTWYDKRRINRQRIQDGDEYFICSEKLSCVFQ